MQPDPICRVAGAVETMPNGTERGLRMGAAIIVVTETISINQRMSEVE